MPQDASDCAEKDVHVTWACRVGYLSSSIKNFKLQLVSEKRGQGSSIQCQPFPGVCIVFRVSVCRIAQGRLQSHMQADLA